MTIETKTITPITLKDVEAMSVETSIDTGYTLRNTEYMALTKGCCPSVDGWKRVVRDFEEGAILTVVDVDLRNDEIKLTDGDKVDDFILSELYLSFTEVVKEHDFF